MNCGSGLVLSSQSKTIRLSPQKYVGFSCRLSVSMINLAILEANNSNLGKAGLTSVQYVTQHLVLRRW